MKILAIVLLALIGTLMLTGPIQSYADPQLDTLLRIASQARDNLSVNISQISNVPADISQLFKQGSDETDALSQAVDQQNITSARQHFLFAMKYFKETNDAINSLNATTSNDQERADIIQLQSEIARLDKIGETLRSIAITNHADINFTQFDQLIQKANEDLDIGNADDASKSIDAANQFVIDAHQSLAALAEQKTTDRAKDFTVKQIERLDKISGTNASQNVIQTPQINSSATINSTMPSKETTKDMIAELKKLVAEGNVNDALKIIKQLESYQSVTPMTTPPVNPPTSSTITPPVNPPTSSTITPPVNPPTSSTITPPVNPPTSSTITPPVNTTIHNPVKIQTKNHNLNETSSPPINETGTKPVPKVGGNTGSENLPTNGNHGKGHHKNHLHLGSD